MNDKRPYTAAELEPMLIDAVEIAEKNQQDAKYWKKKYHALAAELGDTDFGVEFDGTRVKVLIGGVTAGEMSNAGSLTFRGPRERLCERNGWERDDAEISEEESKHRKVDSEWYPRGPGKPGPG